MEQLVKDLIESEILLTVNKLFKKEKDIPFKDVSLFLTNDIKIEEAKDLSPEDRSVFQIKFEKLKKVFTQEPFNPEEISQYLIKDIEDTILQLEENYKTINKTFIVASKKLKDIEDLQKQYKSEHDKYTNMGYHYNGTGSSEFYKKIPELKKKMDGLKSEIPKYRNEFNKAKEPDVYTLKRIDTLKKDLEYYRKKLTFTSSTTENIDENTIKETKNVKECWLCEGECTCDD